MLSYSHPVVMPGPCKSSHVCVCVCVWSPCRLGHVHGPLYMFRRGSPGGDAVAAQLLGKKKVSRGGTWSFIGRHRSRAVTQVQISLGCGETEKYGRYIRRVEWMTNGCRSRSQRSFLPGMLLLFFSFFSPLIHGSVWVKMHNEFIKGHWRNQ